MGPDGAMYIINYAGWFGTHQFQNIARFIYTGDCRPAEPRLEEKVNPNVYYPSPGYGCLTIGDANYDANAYAHDEQACASSSGIRKGKPGSSQAGVALIAYTVYITDRSKHVVEVVDINGAVKAVFRGKGRAQYNLKTVQHSGVSIVRVMTPGGVLVRKFTNF
jgi:hypothetical protein